MKIYSNNKLYTYKDLCKALDEELEQKRKQIAGVKAYFKQNPQSDGYSGRILNELNLTLNLNGRSNGLLLRPGGDRGRIMASRFSEDAVLIKEMQNGIRNKWLDAK